MTWGELKKIAADLSDEAEVVWNDPNFSGEYHVKPDAENFSVENGKLFIYFPFESPVD
jgi:hypothetical protein